MNLTLAGNTWSGALQVGGQPMDAKTRAIALIKHKPIIEGFKNAIAEERRKGASDAQIASMLDYVETISRGIDSDVLEMLMIELTEAAKSTNEGPKRAQ